MCIHIYIYIHIDYVQELFEPVQFSTQMRGMEEATYIHFTRLLNEAEGMSFKV